MNDNVYVLVHQEERVSYAGEFGVRIYVKMNREYNPELDKYGKDGVADITCKVIDKLVANTVLNDPTIENRKKADMERAFRRLFDTPVFVRRIPNQYCGSPCCYDRPWFEVTTPVGLFKIGWRKRVISIDWSGTVGTQSAFMLFQDENTTKEEKLIHAWSYDLAKQYIAAIHSSEPIVREPTTTSESTIKDQSIVT